MPPAVRIPTVEFRSLLLAPIRVRLSTLNSFVRPQCASLTPRRVPTTATCLVQRRSLHLYKTARAKTALGMHKILDFDLYKVKPPSASDHKVDLVESIKNPQKVAQHNVTLQELYEQHVSSGRLLCLVEDIKKSLADSFERMQESNLPSQRKTYAIIEARSIMKKKGKAEATQTPSEGWKDPTGPLKGARINLSSPSAYIRLVLERCYNFIKDGSPVEFAIRAFGSARDDRYKSGEGVEIQKWVHEHFPHLRPDFILKSMPEGTEYLIEPVTDGCVVQFVLGRRPKWMMGQDLTQRAFKVKSSVQRTLSNNAMAQNYLVKERKNQAKHRRARENVEGEASSGDVEPFPFEKDIARHVSSRVHSLELNKTGALSRKAAERQEEIRMNRDEAEKRKQDRRAGRWQERGEQ